MPARLSITEQDQEQVEVDLWGDVFVRLPVTKPRRRAISSAYATLEHLTVVTGDEVGELDVRDEEYAKNLAALDEKSELDLVTAIGKVLDLSLGPLDESVTAKPSALLLKKYKSGDIAYEQIEGFLERLGSAIAGERPT